MIGSNKFDIAIESPSDSGASVGARIKKIRGSKSQRAMASELRVALSGYQNYEHNERDIPSKILLRLHNLGWNPNWILTGEGPERLNYNSVVLNVIAAANVQITLLEALLLVPENCRGRVWIKAVEISNSLNRRERN